LAAKNQAMNEIVNWPQQVSEEVKMKCVRDYFTNSAWRKPAACAVCGRDRFGIPITSYQLRENDELPVGFRTVLNIPRRSIHHGKPEFIFGHSAINNMMLCAKGILVSEECKLTMNVCDHCNACLVPNTRNKGASPKLPKYALANKLYLGCLPERFNDLTWVEEQVCALHRSTIFVYRLYHSDNPQDPYMAKGNSCAHPQNTVSTAKILPRTPADVAGSLARESRGWRLPPLPITSRAWFDRLRSDKVHVWRCSITVSLEDFFRRTPYVAMGSTQKRWISRANVSFITQSCPATASTSKTNMFGP